MRSIVRGVLVALAVAVSTRLAQSQQLAAGQQWVATWGAAQELYRYEPRPAPGAPATAAAAPTANGPIVVNDQTVRMIVRTSLGGRRARLRLAGSFGAPIVEIGSATVALRDTGMVIVAGSARPVHFGGEPSLTLLPGSVATSDPVDIDVPANGDLVVSLYLKGDAGRPTSHPLGLHTTYVSAPGDFTTAPSFPVARTALQYFWLAGIDVAAPTGTSTIVTFGNSITDGAVSTPNTDRMWPARLAVRLAANSATRNVGVVNMGISGNRVLADGAGVSVLARLDRDVFNVPGATWLIFLEGINDIGSLKGGTSRPVVTTDHLIWAYRQVLERAHAHGIKVAFATLTPYGGAGYFSDPGEVIRAAVNEWIRTSHEPDAVIDFDAAVRDPANPGRILPVYDPGDHLHPNDTGYQKMADAVDLRIFVAPNR